MGPGADDAGVTIAAGPRRVVLLAFDGCQPLDVVGPAEVFGGAALRRPAAYDVCVASAGGGLVRGRSAVVLDTVDAAAITGPIDTLVVAGGFRTREMTAGDPTVRAAAALAVGARRVTSVCSGAFVLAAAGLLDGRRVTTHWSATQLLAERHPALTVEADSIWVRDGRYWTSAGVTAGIDLALALVADDLDDALAGEIARWLVMFVRRPGGQSQFSAHLAATPAAHPPIRAVQDWLPANLAEDCSVPALARRAGMSPRHFARRFRDEIGVTPAAHVETLRVEAAKQLLATPGPSLTHVARACGFGTVETFHRTFRRATGTTPDRYRQHFATTPS
jgi:transcriptional regulator GlxA family with amidase domain